MMESQTTPTEEQLRLAADAGIILTKNSVIAQAVAAFGLLGESYRQVLQNGVFPAALASPHPKISKGEKHCGMPWVMLDYPRIFEKSGHLAVRTFFWWGHFFSINLQVSGIYLPAFAKHLPVWLAEHSGWLGGFASDVWDLRLPNENWLPVSAGLANSAAAGFQEEYYLKLAKKIPIGQWGFLQKEFLDNFESLAALIEIAVGQMPGI